MSQKLPARTDGLFGSLYQEKHEPQHMRWIIAQYQFLMKCDYRQAWRDWFDWAMGK